MMDDNFLCGVLELGISAASSNLLSNICEDHGIAVVDKDDMSIIMDVYDTTVIDHSPVKLAIETNEIHLELIKSGEDDVLIGVIYSGEAAQAVNQVIDEFSIHHTDTEDGEYDEDEDEYMDEDDVLTFVIAVGDIGDKDISLIEGDINTFIGDIPLTFNEADLTNMTMSRLEKFHIM